MSTDSHTAVRNFSEMQYGTVCTVIRYYLFLYQQRDVVVEFWAGCLLPL